MTPDKFRQILDDAKQKIDATPEHLRRKSPPPADTPEQEIAEEVKVRNWHPNAIAAIKYLLTTLTRVRGDAQNIISQLIASRDTHKERAEQAETELARVKEQRDKAEESNFELHDKVVLAERRAEAAEAEVSRLREALREIFESSHSKIMKAYLNGFNTLSR